MLFRPTNDPHLTNDVWRVNDLGVEENRRFLARMGGGRPGYTMRWTPDCKVALEPVPAITSLKAPTPNFGSRP